MVRASKEGGDNMKGKIMSLAKIVASIALVLTALNVNTCCAFYAYQPKLPEGADKLCKH